MSNEHKSPTQRISTERLKELIFDLLPEDSLFGEKFKQDKNCKEIDKETFLNTIHIDSLNNNAFVIHHLEKFIEPYFVRNIVSSLEYYNELSYPIVFTKDMGSVEKYSELKGEGFEHIEYEDYCPIIIADNEQSLRRTSEIVEQWENYNIMKRATKAETMKLSDFNNLNKDTSKENMIKALQDEVRKISEKKSAKDLHQNKGIER